MGLLPKYKVEEAKRLHRQKKLARKRKVAVRPVSVSFLIVCEGTRTEPQYFEALVKNHFSDICEVKIEGEGRGTVNLIKQTKTIRDDSEKEYDRVWAVFDKDDFNDFNEAIRLAQKNNIHCAWTNESFELWYYLHFHYLDTGVSRTRYIEMIERELRYKINDPEFTYQKKDPRIYSLLQQHGDESLAFKHAERLRTLYQDTNYAVHKPCTTVDCLVKELEHPESLL